MLTAAIPDLQGYAQELADDFQRDRMPPVPPSKLVGVLVDEPSTRTRLSTLSGAARAGLRTLDIPSMDSLSIAKGESLSDTGAVLGQYFDALAVRAGRAGLPRFLSTTSQLPVLNLGDGSNEHPSQALATLITAIRVFGQVAGRRIVLIGDLAAGRVAHSVFLGAVLCGLHVTVVPASPMPDGYLRLARALGGASPVNVAATLDDVEDHVDILYVTRDQRERRGGRPLPDYPVISLSHVRQANLVLHPLPRGRELPDEVWSEVREPILRHVQTTYKVRQRLLVDMVRGAVTFDHARWDDLVQGCSATCKAPDCVAYGVQSSMLVLDGHLHCEFCLREQ